MMVIARFHDLQVKIHGGAVGDSVEKFPDHLCVKSAECRHSKFSVILQIRASRQIHSREGKHFIHRKDEITVSLDPGFISERLCYCLS